MAVQPSEGAFKNQLAMARRPGNADQAAKAQDGNRPSAQKSNFLSSAQQLAVDRGRDRAQGGKSFEQQGRERAGAWAGGAAGAWAGSIVPLVGTAIGGFIGRVLGKKIGGSVIGKILIYGLLLLLLIGIILIIVGALYAFCDQNRWLLRIASFVDNRAKGLHDVCKTLVTP